MQFFNRKRTLKAKINQIMSIEGQITKAEAEKLFELAGMTGAGKVIIEIGSYRGRSTAALALGSLSGNKNLVYAVDPHAEFVGVLGGEFGPADRAALYKNLTKIGVGHVVAVVSLSSEQAARCWMKKNIGLLWLDGDHSYEGVRSDYEVWIPFLADDGIIAFHDSQVAGVRQLIDELIAQNSIKLIGEIESLSWFRKGR